MERSDIFVLSMVAVVAVVGLATMFLQGGAGSAPADSVFVDEESNVVGEAIKLATPYRARVPLPESAFRRRFVPRPSFICTDSDSDGFQGSLPPGCRRTTSLDCNDADAAIKPAPNGMDICGDGIDQDCSGSDRKCPVCTDTDASFGPDVAGTATGVPYGVSEDDVEPVILSDDCASETSVKERSCGPGYLGGSVIHSTIRDCPAGQICFDSDGLGNSPAYCIAAEETEEVPPPWCWDSDGGAESSRGGSVIVGDGERAWEIHDACKELVDKYGKAAGVRLEEQYCDGSRATSVLIDCEVKYGVGSTCWINENGDGFCTLLPIPPAPRE